jgi:hypothetical protein
VNPRGAAPLGAIGLSWTLAGGLAGTFLCLLALGGS